ncbi:MAG TPA: hypothetical protein VFZ04_18380, partial [Longimicrobiales bacterium]
GSSHLRLTEMGRKYLFVVLKVLAEKWLIRDDLLAERLAHNRQYERTIVDMDDRVRALEHRLERVEQGQMITPIDLVETNPMNQTKGVN